VARIEEAADARTTVPGVLGPLPMFFDGQSTVLSAKDRLENLLATSLILEEDWQSLPADVQGALRASIHSPEFFELLVRHGLLTRYQADRIEAGQAGGLILGHYRVLDRIGAGGMGVVFRGEHVRMRRQVAIKVLPPSANEDPRSLIRFRGEIRAIAQLEHPNIVSALDDGECFAPGAPRFQYFVMEYVPGHDLEELVQQEGPLSPDRACGLAYQIASALAAAHRCNLVHRDIKPSNVRVTPDGQAKLLDFGLVRQFGQRLTVAGAALGTPEYLAPEQARDASTVDIRADIYGLGGVLFWCLTGRAPFSCHGNLSQVLAARVTQPPPSPRSVRPELSAELEAVVIRTLATDPNDRYPTPQAVMNALLGFLDRGSHERIVVGSEAPRAPSAALGSCDPDEIGRQSVRVLVVDDSPTQRLFWVSALEDEGIPCDEVKDGTQALKACEARQYDLVLTDNDMPGLSGLELCRKLRERRVDPHLKVILFSASLKDDAMARAMAAGVDDYLHKQCTPLEMSARVKAALRLKRAREHADVLNRRLATANNQLEQTLTARDAELVHMRSALVLGLAELAAHRSAEGVAHFMRLQRYCRWLAEEAAGMPAFAGQIDGAFIQLLECSAPLHDIGKVGLPDHILAKQGALETAERLILQSHTTLGAETLQRVAHRHGSALAFLQMAIDIARHHHEHYDGTGYPDRLVGDAIPLAARIFAIGDVYDAMRSRQPYKPPLAHGAAMEIILEGSPGKFDPALLVAFERCAANFERTYQDLASVTH
jgi:response regulator RpfG family c-di-GMP phosphodiesterase/serine/threonine protein kinase